MSQCDSMSASVLRRLPFGSFKLMTTFHGGSNLAETKAMNVLLCYYTKPHNIPCSMFFIAAFLSSNTVTLMSEEHLLHHWKGLRKGNTELSVLLLYTKSVSTYAILKVGPIGNVSKFFYSYISFK